MESSIGEPAAPTGPTGSLLPRRACGARIRDLFAAALHGDTGTQEARDLQTVVAGERRRLGFHDAALEGPQNRGGRHGLQSSDLWHPSFGSGGRLMAGRTVFLKELFSVRIGAQRDHRSDHGKIKVFHSALQVPDWHRGSISGLMEKGNRLRALGSRLTGMTDIQIGSA